MSFEKALAFTLPAEGGFVDDPDDPGGATNHGITQGTYDRYRTSIDAGLQSVALISDDEVRLIYRDGYWRAGQCDKLREPLDGVHFDDCVNLGATEAARLLQEVVGAAVDGVIGPQTMAKVEEHDPVTLAQALCDRRAEFYRRLVAARPENGKFLKGWLSRVAALRTQTATVIV